RAATNRDGGRAGAAGRAEDRDPLHGQARPRRAARAGVLPRARRAAARDRVRPLERLPAAGGAELAAGEWCGRSRGDAPAGVAGGAVHGHRRARGRPRARDGAGAEVGMNAVLIARNTYREATRDRVLAGMTVAGVVFLVAIQVLTPLALGEGRRLLVDMGLSAISMLGLLVVLMVGSSLVAKEIERRTIYTLLARPIPRPIYLIGKWAGLTGSACP